MRRLLAAILLASVGGLSATTPAPTPAPPPATAPALDSHNRTQADYDQLAAHLKESLPANFTIVIQPPFVVVGDGPPESVKAASTGTVKWAVDHLKKDYFIQDPDDIITVYLFKDKPSYDRNTNRLLNDTPSTPYGYYSPAHKALIMNISTGLGTLVHEIVHPYIAANFPDCPPWFNEGLGSLYEQSAEKDGHIIGQTNWRLPALQKAIREDKVPPFKSLFDMDNDQFYNQDRGTNYAQSRYLCYYLQQNNLLHDFYKAFLKNQKTDPTGIDSLKQTLKEKDLPAFQSRWQKWVLTLHFP